MFHYLTVTKMITQDIDSFIFHLPEYGPIMGIDYGIRKVGLSICNDGRSVAFPYCHANFSNKKDALNNQIHFVSQNIIKLKIAGIVIGFSCAHSEELRQAIREFAMSLKENHESLPIYLQEEYYTTQEVQSALFINKKKNKKSSGYEDELAATLILSRTIEKMLRINRKNA